MMHESVRHISNLVNYAITIKTHCRHNAVSTEQYSWGEYIDFPICSRLKMLQLIRKVCSQTCAKIYIHTYTYKMFV